MDLIGGFGAILRQRGLLLAAIFVYMLRWYRSLRERVRISHVDAKSLPVVQAFKQQSKALKDGYHPPALWAIGSQYLVGSLMTVFHCIVRAVKKVPHVEFDRELFTLKDGGTVGLDWVKKVGGNDAPAKDDLSKPLIFMHHGLAGSSDSHYIHSMVNHLVESKKYRVCCFVARGCGGIPLTTPYGFTAAGFGDMEEVLAHIRLSNPVDQVKIYGIGYSLGAGLMANYIGRSGKDCTLSAAIVVSACWDYTKFSPYFDIWSRKFLAASLQEYSKNHKEILETHEHMDFDKAMNAVTVHEFDQHATVKVHGFESVHDYHSSSSPINHVKSIHIPTLSLNADDDPVCSVTGADMVEKEELHGPGLVIARTERGGHVAWPEGVTGHGSWMDRVILEWIDHCHQHTE